jgi:polyhydroxyalkanoate synthesis regulator phasin
MMDKSNLQPLIDHLCNNSSLQADEAQKLVAEVIAFFSETKEAWVLRRHAELKHDEGLSNAQIYARIENELPDSVFVSRTLSQRQIRRIIYG